MIKTKGCKRCDFMNNICDDCWEILSQTNKDKKVERNNTTNKKVYSRRTYSWSG